MTTSRSEPSDAEPETEPDDDTPGLNHYEIHADRTVLTEPGNTDGWIASDTTVEPPR